MVDKRTSVRYNVYTLTVRATYMSTYEKVEAFNRLTELQEEMNESIRETEQIMRKQFPYEYRNAEAYWIAHLKTALGNHGFTNSTRSPTFLSCLNKLEDNVYDNELDDS